MKKILYLLVLIPMLSVSQEKKFRVITKDLDTIYASEIRQLNIGKRTSIHSLNGEYVTYYSKDVFAIREEIEGWDYFHWTPMEFTDYVVVEIDSFSQQELFDTTINWIKENYKNPDEVIKTTIDNTKIRMEGYGKDIIKYKGIAAVDIPGKYVIEISFKDGKYKFNPINSSFILSEPIGEVSISLINTSQYYNKKGKMISYFKYFPISIENLFNNLNISLFNYISENKNGEPNEDDW